MRKVQHLVPNIHNMQEFELFSMETTLEDFHRTCDILASFSTLLQELRADKHYKQGRAPYVKLAFLNYLNNVWN
jgi:hypothetical protein